MSNLYLTLKKHLKKFGKKLWLRAVKGAGGKGAFLATDVSKAKFWIDFNSGWGKFTASEYLPGQGFGCDMLFYKGDLIFSQVKERLSYFMAKVNIVGITGTTGILKTVHNKEIDKLCEDTVRAVDPKPNGAYAVDIKCDRSGNFHVTEINCGRFLTSSVALFYKSRFLAPYYAVSLGINGRLPHKIKRINPIPKDIIVIRQLDIEPAIIKLSELDRIKKIRLKHGFARV